MSINFPPPIIMKNNCQKCVIKPDGYVSECRDCIKRIEEEWETADGWGAFIGMIGFVILATIFIYKLI